MLLKPSPIAPEHQLAYLPTEDLEDFYTAFRSAQIRGIYFSNLMPGHFERIIPIADQVVEMYIHQVDSADLANLNQLSKLKYLTLPDLPLPGRVDLSAFPDLTVLNANILDTNLVNLQQTRIATLNCRFHQKKPVPTFADLHLPATIRQFEFHQLKINSMKGIGQLTTLNKVHFTGLSAVADWSELTACTALEQLYFVRCKQLDRNALPVLPDRVEVKVL